MFAVDRRVGLHGSPGVDDVGDFPFGPSVDPGLAPGPRLATQCHSAALVPSFLSDTEVLDVVEGIDRVSRWAAAVRIRMLAEFADRHPSGTDATPPGGDQPSPVDRWLPTEVGMTLRIARLEALAEIAKARRFVHVLPDTLACLEAARIDERRADAIASATALLPDDKAREVEARVLTNAPDATLKQLRDRIRRAVARVDPDGAYRRHKEAVRERSVSIRSLEDGMASLWFYGPAEEIEAAWTMADRLARVPRDPQDERTLDQRRFDMAVQVLQGKLTVTDTADVERAVDVALDTLASAGAETVDLPAAATEGSATGAGRSDDATSAGAATSAAGEQAVPTDGSTRPHAADSTDNADSTDSASRTGSVNSTGSAKPTSGAPPGPVVAPSGARIDRALLTEIVAQLLTARPPLHDTIHKPQIQVVVALDTLLGSDRPAELLGHGPIDAVTARALAAGGVWARLVTDRLSGRLLDYGRTVYAPPAYLADFVRARDQICRGPGCTRKIAELDHHIPFGAGHEGETSEANLDGYCRECHKLKDAPGWNALAGGDDHTLTWISPHGRRTTTAPYDYRAFTDPLTDAQMSAVAGGSTGGTPPVPTPTDDVEPPF